MAIRIRTHISIYPTSPAATSASAPLNLAYALSAAIVPLAAVAATAGLLIAGLYNDNDWVRPQLRGNDLVTAAVAVPLLALATLSARRGSFRGRLIWLGALGYMFYNYLYFSVSAAFNPLFLSYVALTIMSLGALLLGLLTLDWNAVGPRFTHVQVKAVRIFALAIGAGLGLMWIGMALAANIANDVPKVVTDSGHPTAVVFSLDLILIVPLAILTAWSLGRRLAWSYVAAAILLVKAATYGLALLGMALFAWRADQPTDAALIPLWVLVAAGGILLSFRYFRAVREP